MKKSWRIKISLTFLVLALSSAHSHSQYHPSLPKHIVHLSTCSWLHDASNTETPNRYRELTTITLETLKKSDMNESELLDIISSSLDAIVEIPKTEGESDAEYISRLYHKEFECQLTFTEAASLLND